MTTADMWVDPLCPWTWLAAQWLLEVEQVRDVTATFHVMSLSILNEGRSASAEDELTIRMGWEPVRVLTAAAVSLGDPAVRRLYFTLGQLIHPEQTRPINRDLFARALAQADLPHTFANAAGSTFYDDAVRTSHQAGVDPVGPGLGSPIIHVRQPSGDVIAYFGPVVNPCPRGEAAGVLWDSAARPPTMTRSSSSSAQPVPMGRSST